MRCCTTSKEKEPLKVEKKNVFADVVIHIYKCLEKNIKNIPLTLLY